MPLTAERIAELRAKAEEPGPVVVIPAHVLTDLLDEIEAPRADKERLDWLIATGAHVAWSKDSEVCTIWLPNEYDGTEARPAEGYPLKGYYDPREAIEAARRALSEKDGAE